MVLARACVRDDSGRIRLDLHIYRMVLVRACVYHNGGILHIHRMVLVRACVYHSGGILHIHRMVLVRACVRGGSGRICQGGCTYRMEGTLAQDVHDQICHRDHRHGHGSYHMAWVFHAQVFHAQVFLDQICGHDNAHIYQDDDIDHREGPQPLASWDPPA